MKKSDAAIKVILAGGEHIRSISRILYEDGYNITHNVFSNENLHEFLKYSVTSFNTKHFNISIQDKHLMSMEEPLLNIEKELFGGLMILNKKYKQHLAKNKSKSIGIGFPELRTAVYGLEIEKIISTRDNFNQSIKNISESKTTAMLGLRIKKLSMSI